MYPTVWRKKKNWKNKFFTIVRVTELFPATFMYFSTGKCHGRPIFMLTSFFVVLIY